MAGILASLASIAGVVKSILAVKKRRARTKEATARESDFDHHSFNPLELPPPPFPHSSKEEEDEDEDDEDEQQQWWRQKRDQEMDGEGGDPRAHKAFNPPRASRESTPPAQSVDAIFAEVDTDGNGIITYGEFARWWGRKQLARTGVLDESSLWQLKYAWDRYDVDVSGGLDLQEFSAALTEASVSSWVETQDPHTGRTYYYHKRTNETKWECPGSRLDLEQFLHGAGIIDVSANAPFRRAREQEEEEHRLSQEQLHRRLVLVEEALAQAGLPLPAVQSEVVVTEPQGSRRSSEPPQPPTAGSVRVAEPLLSGMPSPGPPHRPPMDRNSAGSVERAWQRFEVEDSSVEI